MVDTAQFPLDASVNPETTRHQGYYRLDPTVASRQVSSIYSVAQALAAELASTDSRAATIIGNCSGASCLDAFVRKAGRVLFRQPLTDAEVAVYTKAAGGGTDRTAVTKVLATMIASPQSYFVVERGGTVSDTNSSPVFAGPQALSIPLLQDAGFDVIGTANNHAWDFGREGLLESIRWLDSAGVAHTGTGATLGDAWRPIVIRRKGWTIAFFSITAIFNNPVTLSVIGHESECCVAWADTLIAARRFAAVRVPGRRLSHAFRWRMSAASAFRRFHAAYDRPRAWSHRRIATFV